MNTSQLPLDTLGGTIKAHITAGDKAVDKAADHYKAAGFHLIEAKEMVAQVTTKSCEQSSAIPAGRQCGL